MHKAIKVCFSDVSSHLYLSFQASFVANWMGISAKTGYRFIWEVCNAVCAAETDPEADKKAVNQGFSLFGLSFTVYFVEHS